MVQENKSETRKTLAIAWEAAKARQADENKGLQSKGTGSSVRKGKKQNHLAKFGMLSHIPETPQYNVLQDLKAEVKDIPLKLIFGIALN